MSPAGTIESLFARDIRRRIEEVIKLHQTDETVVAEELDEYVATRAIRNAYLRILERYVETPLKPHEGIGVWVSGFFGSGKSSFAKYLGLALADRPILGISAADRLADRLADDRVRVLLGRARREIPTLVVPFDMAEDPLVRVGEEKITLVAYRALLRTLGYSDDPDLAELEITLEREDRLAEFERLYHETFGRPWVEGRANVAVAFGRASRIMHMLDPQTFPSADSWARGHKRADLGPRDLAERVLELVGRRCPQVRAVVFVADEVGQYIARSTDKMLDVQGLVQALGHVGRGRTWFVATSQEKLDSLVSYLDERRVELARVRDRFPREIEVDLAPGDIFEVTSRRILAKKPEVRAAIEGLYDRHCAELQVNIRLRSDQYAKPVDRAEFVNLYPFLPYQIDLLIRIVGGMRGYQSTGLQTGGAIRTVVKLAQQVLIHEHVNLASRPIGHLVTLDMFYPLLEGLIASEKRQDIDQIDRTFGIGSMESRVARAITLLEYVKDPARTVENLAAVLYPALGAPSVKSEVEQALDRLVAARLVQPTDEGYSLLTPAAKSWEEERNKQKVYLGDVKRIEREVVAVIAEGLPGYQLEGLREFKPCVVLDGSAVSKGDVEIRLFLVDEAQFDSERESKRHLSRQTANENLIFWVAAFTREIEDLEREIVLSEKMIQDRDRPHVKGEEAALLNAEKTKRDRNRSRLETALRAALLRGECYFRGVAHPLGITGNLAQAVRGVLQDAVPAIYDRFRVAAVRLKGDEASRLLKDADLSGLPAVLYPGGAALGLVEVHGSQRRINQHHEGLEAVTEFIRRRRQFGERTTGQALEQHFGRPPYGWDGDAVRLFVAAAFRLGRLEVVHGGRRLRRRDEPGVVEVFEKTPNFRGSVFLLREEAIDMTTLMTAVAAVERLFGDSPHIEEGAIAAVVRKRLPAEREVALRVAATLRAVSLPGAERAGEIERTYQALLSSSDEDLVRTLAAEAQSVQEDRDWLRLMAESLTEGNLATLRRARRAAHVFGQQLLAHDPSDVGVKEAAGRINSILSHDGFCTQLDQLATDARYLEDRYQSRYSELRERLCQAVEDAADEVRAHPRWPELTATDQQDVLSPLLRLLPPAPAHSADDDASRSTQETAGPTLQELGLRLQTVSATKERVLADLHRVVAPPEQRVERVKVTRVMGREIATAEDVERVVNLLRDFLLKLVQEGVRIILE